MDDLGDLRVSLAFVAHTNESTYAAEMSILVDHSDSLAMLWRQQFYNSEDFVLRMMRRHRSLRDAYTRFKDFRREFLQQMEDMQRQNALLRTMPDPKSFAELFIMGDRNIIQPALKKQRVAVHRFLHRLDKVAHKSRGAANSFIYIMTALAFSTLLALGLALRFVVDETTLQLENQEKLVRQQSHEMRNK